jgi:hypothetical protein
MPFSPHPSPPPEGEGDERHPCPASHEGERRHWKRNCYGWGLTIGYVGKRAEISRCTRSRILRRP